MTQAQPAPPGHPVPSAQVTTAADLTGEVLRAYGGTADPRLLELVESLVRHLHAFVTETSLTGEEWLAGIRFLTETGQMCDDVRQEFILLSDALGVSSLVDLISQLAGGVPGATESTILGPFYVPGAPRRERGSSIGRAQDGEPVLVRGRVTDTLGRPLAGAALDIWQNAANGRYDVQDPGQPAFNLRGRFSTDPEGSYELRAVRPVSYRIPTDGPVGRLLRASGRHGWRAAHIHAIVTAIGHRPVTTHVFDAENGYLDSDTVFGVKDSLVRRFRPGPGDPGDVSYVVEVDFALAPADRPGLS